MALANNELRSVKTARAIGEAGSEFTQIESSVIPDNNGKLVAARGSLTFTRTSDPDYNVPTDSYALVRRVEIGQWRETVSGSATDAERTYTYSLVWSPTQINSANFPDAHKNTWPTDSLLQSAEFFSNDVKMGEFHISHAQIRQLPINNPINVNFAPAGYTISTIGGVPYMTNSISAEAPALMGQVRISFLQATASEISVIAKQDGPNFVAYTSKNKTEINRVFPGMMSGEQMVEAMQAENKAITWVLRIIMTMLICIGFSMVFTPVHLLVRMVPFLGRYIGKATQVIAKVIGAVIGIALSLVLIAISWIVVRPLVAIPMLLVGVGLFMMVFCKKKEK
jgi:hypothetical protein